MALLRWPTLFGGLGGFLRKLAEQLGHLAAPTGRHRGVHVRLLLLTPHELKLNLLEQLVLLLVQLLDLA